MNRRVGAVLYVLLMVSVIVGVDLAFFRNRFWERLGANIVIAGVFVCVYVVFVRNR